MLGANGTGKSTLLYNWKRQHPDATIVSGNREIIFSSPAISISPNQMSQFSRWAQEELTQTTARHARGHSNGSDFLETQLANFKARGDFANQEYVRLDREGEELEKQKVFDRIPIDRANKALGACQIPLSIQWNEKSELITQRERIEGTYGFNQMSDGERSALVLTMCTVLAEENSIIFIDEPERHLHRSISSLLLEFLKADRPDLTWVIATHDLSLAKCDPSASTLILYEFSSEQWNAEFVSEPSLLPPELQEAIYGARERVLFVEGNETSLDKKLHSLFFPGTTIIGAGNCRAVEASVTGLHKSTGIHHMKSAGLIDSDNRGNLAHLAQKGIKPLGLYAVESIYFHSSVIEAVLRFAGTEDSVGCVTKAACHVISDEHLARFARDAAYKSFRHAFISKAPSVSNFDTFDGTVPILPGEDYESHADIQKRLMAARDRGDWDTLIAEIKVKGTPACGEIARKLQYKSAGAYEIAAQKVLKEDKGLVDSLRRFVPDPFSQ